MKLNKSKFEIIISYRCLTPSWEAQQKNISSKLFHATLSFLFANFATTKKNSIKGGLSGTL